MEKGLQYRRTDRAIMNAFIKLVNQGSFEKLTVQEILVRHLSAAIPFTRIIVINTTLQSNYLKNIKKIF